MLIVINVDVMIYVNVWLCLSTTHDVHYAYVTFSYIGNLITTADVYYVSNGIYCDTINV